MPYKILVMYDSRTGNTQKLAEAVAEGINQVPEATAELKRTEDITPDVAAEADGYAIGSPSHFGIMSGRILTLMTDLYCVRDKMAGKPMAIFTTGTGGQVNALENLEKVVGSFNPEWIKPGTVVESEPQEADKKQAMKMGKRLGQSAAKQTK